MVLKMRMSFLVALVGILSLVLGGLVDAQGSPGVLIDSVHVTDYDGYMRTMNTGWDPSYTVTEFGPYEPIMVIMNYTITDSDPLPLKIKAVFKAFGDRRVILNKKKASGSYSETQMFFPVSSPAGDYSITCILKVRHRGDVVGSSKVTYQVTWSN